MTKMLRTFSFLTFVLAAPFALAVDDGFYLRLGSQNLNFDVDASPGFSNRSSHSLDGMGLYLGERVGIWSVEFGYVEFEESNLDASTGSHQVFGTPVSLASDQQVKGSASGFEINSTVDLLDIGSSARVQFLVHANKHKYEIDIPGTPSSSDFRYGVGVGIEFDVNERMGADLRALSTAGSFGLSVGLLWR